MSAGVGVSKSVFFVLFSPLHTDTHYVHAHVHRTHTYTHTHTYTCTHTHTVRRLQCVTVAAYKYADGRKVDGRRLVVDVEKGRTTKGWKPRRLGVWDSFLCHVHAYVHRSLVTPVFRITLLFFLDRWRPGWHQEGREE